MQIQVSEVECKKGSDGQACYKLTLGDRNVMVAVDATSGEGRIVGEKDSTFYIDAKTGDDVVVSMSSWSHTAVRFRLH